ncbi:MAG: hypothetical protein ABIY55_01470 [Kofleriaceae bacterium]
MRCCLLTLVFVIACKDKPVELPPPPEPPHDGVKLIQPGTAPRQVLRYQLTKGARTTSTLVCDYAIKNDGAGDAIPTLVVELETVVDDVLADGSAKLRFTLTGAHPRVAPGTVAPDDLEAQAMALQGVVISELLAPDGKSSGARVEAAATVPEKVRPQLDSLLASLEHVVVQVPTEPIGVDATWQERRTLPPGGITGVSEILYTVTALPPGAFTYTSTGLLTGGPQTIERDGMKIEVSNTTGHASAKGTVALASYALDVEVSSVFSATMNAIAPKDTPGSGSSTVEITMATRMTPGTTPGVDAAAPGDAGVAAGNAAAPGDASAAPGDAAPPAGDAQSDAAPSAGSAQGAHSAP